MSNEEAIRENLKFARMVAGIVERAVEKINQVTPSDFTEDDIISAVFAESVVLLNNRNGTEQTIDFLFTYADQMQKLNIAKKMQKH